LNWSNGVLDQIWDNTGATEAIFGNSGANYNVSVATGSVITVGDLTHVGTNKMSFLAGAATADRAVITLAGDATWNTGGGEIEFRGLNNRDVGLNLGGNTLTVGGGGTFDAGERGTGVPWNTVGGNVIFSDATVVRAASYNLGVSNISVTMTGGTFVNERNTNQTFNNDFVLNADTAFTSRFRGNRRSIFVDGEVDGTGRLVVSNMNTSTNGLSGFLRLNNAANEWSGGLTVDGVSSDTMVLIAGGDTVLGALPSSFDADNIILKDGGIIIKMNGLNMNANRGVTLDGGGVIVNLNNANTINGVIAGSGGLTIGRAIDTSGNQLNLNGVNTYTGGTDIVRGTLNISNDNELGAAPASFDADNIILCNGARLKMNVGGSGVTLGANRGITLDGGGTLINGSAAHTVNGPITGTGGLTIGVTGDGSGNRTIPYLKRQRLRWRDDAV
jgi:autotransporter-associated beta strand protein